MTKLKANRKRTHTLMSYYNIGFFKKNILLWNKLESDVVVADSEIGPDGTVTGSPTYAAAKFNNGIEVNANGEYAVFSGFDIINLRAGAFDLWIKPNFASTSTTQRFILDFNVAGGGGKNSYHRLLWTTGSQFQLVASNGTFSPFISHTFSSGDLVHIGCTWDENGIGGGANNLEIRINNGSPSGASGTLFNTPIPDPLSFRLGNKQTNDTPWDGIIDNIKVWNFIKTEFSNKDTEDAT